MEKANRVNSRVKNFSLKVSKLICAVPIELPLHGHPKQASYLAQLESKRERHGDIHGSF